MSSSCSETTMGGVRRNPSLAPNAALPEGNIKPGYQQVKGAIEDKTLNVYLRGVYLWYDLQPDGSLEAHWTRDHKMVLTCKMTRLK